MKQPHKLPTSRKIRFVLFHVLNAWLNFLQISILAVFLEGLGSNCILLFYKQKHQNTDTCIAFLCRLGKNNLKFLVWIHSYSKLTQQCPLKYSGQWCLPHSITIHDVSFSYTCYATEYTSQSQLLNECISLTQKRGLHLSHLKRTFFNQKGTTDALASINLSVEMIAFPSGTKHYINQPRRYSLCSWQ